MNPYRLTTCDVARYEVAGEERQLVLVDLASRNGLWTLLDLPADGHVAAGVYVVEDAILNFAEAGDAADAHVARSLELRRPATAQTVMGHPA